MEADDAKEMESPVSTTEAYSRPRKIKEPGKRYVNGGGKRGRLRSRDLRRSNTQMAIMAVKEETSQTCAVSRMRAHRTDSHDRCVRTVRRYAKPTSGTYESLNYDEAENNSLRSAHAKPEAERRRSQRREDLVTWVVVLTSGFLIGSIAHFTTWANELITSYKFDALYAPVARGDNLFGWLSLSAFVVPLAMIAALLTRWSPEAAGSGIPHVKAFLNGNRLDGALRPRTLVSKVIGIICCVATGMPAGREGPMVHTGAIVFNVVGTSRLLQDLLRVNFHNDFVRRNFVSMGAAAGVSAAFHAPIGGILFSLEEVSAAAQQRQ